MEVGQRVRIAASAFTRAGEVGEIVFLAQNECIVRFEDGGELGYLIDEDEVESIE